MVRRFNKEDVSRALALLDQFERAGAEAPALQLLRELGVVHQHQLGDAATAVSFFERALAKAEGLGGKAVTAQVRSDLGLAYLHAGKKEEAHATTKVALEELKACGERQSVGIALGNLGVINRHLGRWEDARRYSREALILDEALGDLVGKAEDTKNLGYVYKGEGKVAEAAEQFLAAAAVFNTSGNASEELTARILAAEMLNEDGRHQEVISELTAAQEIESEGSAEARPLLHHNLGLAYLGLADLDRARRELERAVEVSQAGSMRGKMLVTLGDVLRRGEALVEAALVYSRAIEDFAVGHVGEELAEGACRRAKAVLVSSFDSIPKSDCSSLRARLERARMSVDSKPTPFRRELLRLMIQLEVLRRDDGSALARMHEFLPVAKATGDEVSVAMVSEMLGKLERRRGNIDTAGRLRDESRQMFAALGSPEMAAVQQIGVANALKERGQYEEAAAAYKRAIEAGVPDEDRENYEYAICSLADTQRTLGDLQGAIASLTGVLSDCGGGTKSVALAMLAFCYEDLNQSEQALRLHIASLRVAGERSHIAGQISALANIGRVLGAAGALEEARKAFGDALNLARQSDYLVDEPNLLESLGAVNAAMGDPIAIDYLELALEMNDRRGARHNSGNVLGQMALYYERAGDLAGAEERLTRAISIFRQVGAVDRLYSALWRLGELKYRQDEHDQAEQLFDEAITQATATRANLVLDEHKLSLGEDKAEMFWRFAAFNVEDKNEAGKAFTLLESGKSRALLDLLGQLPLKVDLPEQLQEREAAVMLGIRSTYQQLVSEEDGRRQSELMREFDVKREELGLILDELEDTHPEYVAIRRGEPIGFKRLKVYLQ